MNLKCVVCDKEASYVYHGSLCEEHFRDVYKEYMNRNRSFASLLEEKEKDKR